MSFLSVDEMVEDKLYLSARPPASRASKLQEFNIKGVINLVGCRNPHPELVEYYQLPNTLDDVDGANALPLLDPALDWIRDCSGRVLVHCSEGKSRSPTFVVAYLMRECGMRLLDAIWHVMDRRRRALPRDSFVSQLMEYERILVERGVLGPSEDYVYFTMDDFRACVVRRMMKISRPDHGGISHETALAALISNDSDVDKVAKDLMNAE